MSNLETQNCKLKQENIQLRIDNDSLKDRLNSVSYVVSDLNTKIKDIECEKLSLVTAIKLLQEDNNLATINNRDSACSSWQTSRSKAQSNAHNTPSNDGHNITVRMTDQNNQAPEAVTKTSNPFEILFVESCSDNESDTNVDVDDSTLKLNTVLPSESRLNSPNVDSRKHDSVQKKSQSTQSYGQNKESNSKSNENKNRSYRSTNSKSVNTSQKGTTNQPSKLVFIAGDSIVQHVHGWELSDAERRVAVKSFSGSKIEDMRDFLKPLIRKKPDEVILHIGTNDVKDNSKSAEVVAAGILNLGTQVKESLPGTKVSFSSITVRKDRHSIQNKIENVNAILKRMCIENNWTYIDNNNIDYTCLNRRGLHLKKNGNSIISKNYSHHLRLN